MSVKPNKTIRLTPRRMEILKMIHLPKAAIAKALKVDFYTIRDHIRALRKAGIIKGGGNGVAIDRKMANKRATKAGYTYVMPQPVLPIRKKTKTT